MPPAKTQYVKFSDIEIGLAKGDVSKIWAHSSDLRKVTRSLTSILTKKQMPPNGVGLVNQDHQTPKPVSQHRERENRHLQITQKDQPPSG